MATRPIGRSSSGDQRAREDSPFATEAQFRAVDDHLDAVNVPTQDQDTSDLQQQLDEANERVLRSHAELENYRKRSRREMEEQHEFIYA